MEGTLVRSKTMILVEEEGTDAEVGNWNVAAL